MDLTDTAALEDLAARLREAARAYYDTDTLTMTDAEYDDGIEQLRMAVAQDPSLAPGLADLLEAVAGGQSAGGDVRHPTPMLSMAKANSIETLDEFVAKVDGPLALEPKLDGLAVRAVYEAGRLAQVVTRGDGTTGEDVTAQASSIAGMPAVVAARGTFEVRGEVYITDADFPVANERRVAAGKAAFVNPRNAVAGSLRNAEADYTVPMTFAAYDLTGELDAGQHLPASHVARMAAIGAQGFGTAVGLLSVGNSTPTPLPSVGDSIPAPLPSVGNSTPTPLLTPTENPTTSTEVIHAWIEAVDAARTGLGFPIDGVVLKADDDADRERMGTATQAPRWARAYKFAAETATTVVRDIETSVGRTGRLALRARVDPVFVGGATVTYASLHNVSWLQEKDIRIGDTVVIKRANDVIPYIVSAVLDQRPEGTEAWVAPETDPAGRPWDKSTLLWRSTSPELSVLGRIVYACSRDCLDIEGLGVEVASALVEGRDPDQVADDVTATGVAEDGGAGDGGAGEVDDATGGAPDGRAPLEPEEVFLDERSIGEVSLGEASIEEVSLDETTIEGEPGGPLAGGIAPGAGESAADAVREPLVRDLADLFSLTEQDLSALVLSGRALGAKTATKIVAEIDRARSAPLNRVITALGIRMTGRTMGRRLAAAFGSMARLRAADTETLAAVDGIGPVRAEVIHDALVEMGPVIDKLAAAGVAMGVEPPEAAETEDRSAGQDGAAGPDGAVGAGNPEAGRGPVLAGRTVVATGAMTGPLAGLSRNEMNELIEAHGGKASGSVSSRTSLLVCGQEGSGKYVKAQSLGIAIVSPEEFAEMIGYTG